MMPAKQQQELGSKQEPAHAKKEKGRGKKGCARQVRFAPGPLSTQDGHPTHEGLVARPRRSLGVSWGHDLTPSSITELEVQLGEECRPSIDRLKRRVGLLPLRRRPKEYLTWMLDSESSEEEETIPAVKKGKAQKRKLEQQAEGAAAMQPSTSGADVAGAAESKRQRRRKQQHAEPGHLGSNVHGGSSFSRAAAAGAPSAALAIAAANTTRVHLLLGGRKPRQKAGPSERLVPPNRIRAGIKYPHTPLGATSPAATGLGPLPAAALPAVTVTLNRKGGKQAHTMRPATAGSLHVNAAAAAAAAAAAVAANGLPAATSGSTGTVQHAAALPLAGRAPLGNGAAAAEAGDTAAAASMAKKGRRLGSLVDPLVKSTAGALWRGLRGGTMR